MGSRVPQRALFVFALPHRRCGRYLGEVDPRTRGLIAARVLSELDLEPSSTLAIALLVFAVQGETSDSVGRLARRWPTGFGNSVIEWGQRKSQLANFRSLRVPEGLGRDLFEGCPSSQQDRLLHWLNLLGWQATSNQFLPPRPTSGEF